MTCVALALMFTPAFSNAQTTLPGGAAQRQLVVRQWIRASETGELRGTLVRPAADGQPQAVGNAQIAVARASGPVLLTHSSETGEFTIADVQPGVYAFAAFSDQGKAFAIYALHVVPRNAAGSEQFPESVTIAAASLGADTVLSAMARYLPPVPPGTPAPRLGAPEFGGLGDTMLNGQAARVYQRDGGLDGRIWLAGANGPQLPAAANINVFVYQGGTEVARAVTGSNGEFRLENLAAGQYDVLAVGPGGIGVLGFHLVTDDDAAQPIGVPGIQTAEYRGKANGNIQLASALNGPQNNQAFDLQLAPVIESAETLRALIEEQLRLTQGAFQGGGAGVGSGGGGGGGGGGDLLGLAGLAAGLAALASDDDGFTAPGATSDPVPAP